MLPRDIIDHIAAFVGVLDPDGTVVEVNETTLRVSGSSRSEIVGRKFWECGWFGHDPRAIGQIREAVERAAGGESVRFDATARTASGDLMAIDLMIYPIRDEAGRITSLIPSAIDITERKRFETDLQRSLDLLERAQRIGHLGHWSYDIATEKLEWSAEARRIFFSDRQPAEVSAEMVTRLIHPDDVDRVRAGMIAAVMERHSFSASYRIRRDDGEERIIEVEADPDYSPDGQPVRFFGIVRDVTQAHLRERQLTEQQQLVDLSLEPILCWSLDDGLLHWNPGCQKLYGYSREEALGRAPQELLSSQFPVPVSEIRELLQAGESWTGEVTQTTRDGRQVMVEARIDPVISEERRIVMEAHRDITAHRQAERDLKISEERLAIAAELTGLGTYDRDFATGLIQLSPEPCGKVLGETVTLERMLSKVHPADLPGVRAAVAQSEDPSGSGLYEEEHRIVLPSGEVRWISVNGRTFFEGEGSERHPVRAIGALLDVTDRRMFDEQQRLLMGELNHRVRNTLSVVQAIASQTLRSARDPRSFVEDFKGRIQSIASAHKLLNETTWQGANLTDLLREQLASSCGSGQVYTDGPEVWLPPQVALNLGLVLYELGTNARKYGALSAPGGRVQISWEVRREDDKSVLRLDWREFGGPPVRPPAARGFGMGLIERTIGSTVEGETEIKFLPEGLQCAIELALANSPPQRPTSVGP